MNATEIKAELSKWEKRKKSAGSPDEVAFAEKKLAKLQAELKEAEKAPEKKEDKKPEKKAPEKKEDKKPEKKAIVKKPALKIPAKIIKSTKTVELDGKIYTEKDKEFCEVLLKTFAIRRQNMAKANRKYKTVSVSSKISKDVAHSIHIAIDEVSASKISANPKQFISLVEKAEKASVDLLSALEAIVKFDGGRLNKTDIKAEMEAIHEMVEKVKAKLKSKK